MIKLTFTGDLMSLIPQNKYAFKKGSYNYDSVFGKILGLLSESDYVIGNLETPVAGEEFGYTSLPTVFNTPIEFTKAAQNAGFDFLSLANNHCLDRGHNGLKSTIENIKNLGIDYSGAYLNEDESKIPFIKEINGIRIAILTYTYGTNSKWQGHVFDNTDSWKVDLTRAQDKFVGSNKPSVLGKMRGVIKGILPQYIVELIRPNVIGDCVEKSEILPEDKIFDDRMKAKIEYAKQNADISIMYLHSGGQYNDEVGNYTKTLSRRIIEYGCDHVVCSHPHCVLGYENIDEHVVFYSLGNFCFTPEYGYYKHGVFADYSILLNFYIDNQDKSVKRKTVVIAKCVRKGDGSEVVPVVDLYGRSSIRQQKKLKSDCLGVLKRLTGKESDIEMTKYEIDIM